MSELTELACRASNWCRRIGSMRGKYLLIPTDGNSVKNPLGGVREMGFAQTALAHGNMEFGKRKY